MLLQTRPTSAQEVFLGGIFGFLTREVRSLPCTQVRYEFIRKVDDKRDEPRYNESEIIAAQLEPGMQRHSYLSLTDRGISGLHRKLALAHAAVTLAAVFIAEGVVLTIRALTSRESVSAFVSGGIHIALVATGAALAGLLLGAWISRRVSRRLQRTLDISNAWLRGNLSLRITDSSADDIGLLAEQLDMLVEKLEQDEEDLEELRERNDRLTDQVRTLAVVEERNRLARELHDSVKQHLFSLAMTTSAIRTHLDVLQCQVTTRFAHGDN